MKRKRRSNQESDSQVDKAQGNNGGCPIGCVNGTPKVLNRIKYKSVVEKVIAILHPESKMTRTDEVKKWLQGCESRLEWKSGKGLVWMCECKLDSLAKPQMK